MKNTSLALLMLSGVSALIVGCNGSSGGGGGVVTTAVQHDASACPNLKGKYQFVSDPTDIIEITRNETGELILVLDPSNPVTVNGKVQTSKDGNSTLSATCSNGEIKLQGTDEGAVQSGVLRKTEEGFVIELQQPHAVTAEYIPVVKKDVPATKSLEESN